MTIFDKTKKQMKANPVASAIVALIVFSLLITGSNNSNGWVKYLLAFPIALTGAIPIYLIYDQEKKITIILAKTVYSHLIAGEQEPAEEEVIFAQSNPNFNSLEGTKRNREPATIAEAQEANKRALRVKIAAGTDDTQPNWQVIE